MYSGRLLPDHLQLKDILRKVSSPSTLAEREKLSLKFCLTNGVHQLLWVAEQIKISKRAIKRQHIEVVWLTVLYARLS